LSTDSAESSCTMIMKRAPLTFLAASFIVGGVAAWVATQSVPQPIEVAFGLPVVFLLPGLALAWTVLPEFWTAECLIAGVGLSLIVATCVAVLLAATPLGLSRETFGASLGSLTMLLSVYAMIRVKLGTRARQTPLLRVDEGLGASELVSAEVSGDQRPRVPAHPPS
jgi:uncharacterized membrane protein